MYDDEQTEGDFLSQMGDVKPLSQDKINTHSSTRALEQKQRISKRHQISEKSVIPLTFENIEPLAPDSFLSYKQSGIQDGVYKNLRLGKYHIDTKINLSGLNIKDSAQRLYQTIQQAHSKGQRALLVHHGRGDNSKPFPAFKKSHVNHWLLQIPEVIAFHTANTNHGGLGATYVLLKKHHEQKQINRELNRRR